MTVEAVSAAAQPGPARSPVGLHGPRRRKVVAGRAARAASRGSAGFGLAVRPALPGAGGGGVEAGSWPTCVRRPGAGTVGGDRISGDGGVRLASEIGIPLVVERPGGGELIDDPQVAARGLPGAAPRTVAVPAVGVARPARMRSSVVLPAPFGPTRAVTWPTETVRSQSRTAQARR